MTLLDFVCDFTDWKAAEDWIDTVRKKRADCSSSARVTWLDWKSEDQHAPFGFYQSKRWRQFVLAVYAADLMCYDDPDDQVTFDRLLYVMHAFPEGFRLWWIESSDGTWIPCGYTGWYPMQKTAFDTFLTRPETVVGRMVVPVQESSYLYLFNYSVLESLKKQPLTKTMLSMYAEDIARQNPSGLACITVSPDGARVAGRFGMHQSKDTGIWIYTQRE